MYLILIRLFLRKSTVGIDTCMQPHEDWSQERLKTDRYYLTARTRNSLLVQSHEAHFGRMKHILRHGGICAFPFFYDGL
jgi:hypothetical protein